MDMLWAEATGHPIIWSGEVVYTPRTRELNPIPYEYPPDGLVPFRPLRLRKPDISRFMGMFVSMIYSEGICPRFKVRYGRKKASFAIESLELLEGSLPKWAIKITTKWAELHRDELLQNWDRLRNGLRARKIEALE